MKRNKLCIWLLLTAVFFSLFAFPIHADIGPKPSVRVNITGLEGRLYYITLLSEHSSTGPASAYDGKNAHYEEGDDGYDVWKKFVEYEDADDFYFLQQFKKCIENEEYVWGYYPPHTFKILFYFPESESFLVSDIHERYAFDSYFAASVAGDSVSVSKAYDYTLEIVSLLARIVLTILLEMALALLFGYRGKKALGFLMGVNLITQIILNVILNVVNFQSGQWAFVAYYIFLELIIFVLEALAYALMMPKLLKGEKRTKAIVYALLANGVSFATGMGIARLIPGIF